MKRLDNKTWSPPVSVGMASVGIGLQIGAQKVDVVLVLNDKNAVRSFESHGQMKLGGDYSIAAGPIGRNFSADVSLSSKGVAGTYSYSMSQGAFAGFSLEGQVLVMRGSDNKSFYNQKEAHLSTILAGTVPVPEQDGKRAAVQALHQVLLNIARNVRYDSGLDHIDPAIARDINGDLDDDDGAAEAEGVPAAAAPKPKPPIDETPHGHNITDDDDLVRAQRKAQQAKQKQQQAQQQAPPPPPPQKQKQQQPQQQQMVKATATATATATPNVVQQQQAVSGKNLLVGALDMHQQPAGTGWGESTDLLGLYAPPAVVATPNPYATATTTATPNPYATATPNPYAAATPNPYATATPNPYATATPNPYATATATPNPYATTATANPYDNPYDTAAPAPNLYDNPYAAAAPTLFEPSGTAGFPGAAAPSALPGYGAALPATGLLATNGFAAPPAPELFAGLPRLVVVRDHAVDELSPAIAAHSIVTVHRGDPLYLVDGTVTKGMAPPYADYVTVQRLADGKIGKVSRFCVMDG